MQSEKMSTPNEKENVVALNPVVLSNENFTQSPTGAYYDVLIKPAKPCAGRKVLASLYSTPTHPKDVNEKLKSAEERKKNLDLESQEKWNQKNEKIEAAKSYVRESIENHHKKTIEKVQKKELTSEEILINQKKELEDKRLTRALRAQEAKQIAEENKEKKRKQAETQLAQLKIAEELREANRQAVIDKAKEDLSRVENTRAAQEKKKAELDEKVRTSLLHAEENRLKQLSSIKEKCGNHVKDAKTRAQLCAKEKEKEELI